MALAIGKVAILLGAGLVGSVLAKEGRMPKVSDVFSGAYKVLHKLNNHDDTKSSSSKPRSDSLMAQLNSLRQEMQILSSNRPIAIVTSTGSGSNKYGIIIVIVVLGYGYVWWKGWRLSDMMFATKRGLLDACNDVGKRLDNVHSSIGETKRDLSSRIDRVDSGMDEIAENTDATQGEISELRKEVHEKAEIAQSLNHFVQSLQTRLHSFAERQDWSNAGIAKLLHSSQENSRSFGVYSLPQDSANAGIPNLLKFSQENLECTQGATSSASRPALKMPPATPFRTTSLPPIPLREPAFPFASNRSFSMQRPLRNAATATGLTDLIGISEPSELLSTPRARVADVTTSNGASGGLFGHGFPGSSFFARTRSGSRLSQ